MTIKIGNVVRLKSGGPAMTVVSNNRSEFQCMWFSNKDELYNESFTPASLEVQEGTSKLTLNDEAKELFREMSCD